MSALCCMRAEVAEALAALQFPHIYPDPEARRLRAALAKECGVPAENLMAGALSSRMRRALGPPTLTARPPRLPRRLRRG